MTDRELLELAAKACRYEFNGTWFHEDSGLLVWEPPRSYESRDWNPLTDDGDALRLAVTLQLDITHNNPLDNHRYVCASRCGIEMVRDPVSEVEEFDDESWRIYATCRAIVRTAAEIGKQMKEQTP